VTVSVLAMEPSGPVRGAVTPPGSKSYTNRALLVAALAQGTSTITNVLDADDTRFMAEALLRLGLPVEADFAGGRCLVHGKGGEIPARQAELYVGNAGTAMRFLTALVSLGHGRYRLDGDERMRERPIGDLLRALATLGVKASGEGWDGECPPVVIEAAGLAGGEAHLPGSVSSQFLSALLMVAPYARSPVTIHVEGPLVSSGYVDMTVATMKSFGVGVDRLDHRRLVVPTGRYEARQYAVEADASSASYFFAAAAVTGGRVRVDGLDARSLQGDVHFVDVLEEMGCEVSRGEGFIEVAGGRLRGGTWDMSEMPDAVPTLAGVACFVEGPTTVTHVAHLRYKETDRLRALATELEQLGARVRETDDGLFLEPGPLHGAEVRTYGDHRMAMSLALVGLRVVGVRVQDPGCVSKSYPHFFEDLRRITTPASSSSR
jgi:3-phosphoshikimate 1-carboxyvinyltransferase